MSRCDACPVDEPSCAGETRPTLCDLVSRGNPLWIRHVLSLTASQAAPISTPIPSVPRLPVRTYHATTRALLSCPYRDHHCGCNIPTCHAGYGNHDGGEKASREHCLACLKATWGLI